MHGSFDEEELVFYARIHNRVRRPGSCAAYRINRVCLTRIYVRQT